VTFGLLSKVTRCKSGTNTSHNKNNGYTPYPKPLAQTHNHLADTTILAIAPQGRIHLQESAKAPAISKTQ
ncbi:hypothetical protein ACW9I4_30395, partial [Pseudomonas sp. SDT2931_S440]